MNNRFERHFLEENAFFSWKNQGKVLDKIAIVCYTIRVAKKHICGYLCRCLILKTRTVAWREAYGREKTKKWRKEHERYFNETIIRSWCSLWTSNKKMEP